MNITVVSGSSRPDGQSLKIAKWAQSKLAGMGHAATLIDLHTLRLPLDINLDVTNLNESPEALTAWNPVRSQLQEANGFVFVSPEWNGMAPPALLNFILYGSADETKPFAHKPIQLITVSNGRGGDYPAAELKAYGMKNALGVYIPGHVAVRNCRDMFNGPEPAAGNKDDAYIQKRTLYALQSLLLYAKPLTAMRANSTIDLLAYPNGM
ncbi:MAG TPA: NAD(P)H-dependent oxidoreductase [Candidatus Saccharimonadales bacterium]|nr:NAD(P)H-dependent oxidoreductase [Candidatus Saccharimonadales bacterium]